MPFQITCDTPAQVTCDKNTVPPNTYKVTIVAEGVTITLGVVPLAQLQGIVAKLNEPQPVQGQGEPQGEAPSSLTSYQQWKDKQANPPTGDDPGTTPGE